MKPDYFEYLKNRSSARLFLRKLFLQPIAKYFSGKVLDIGAGIGEFLELYPDATGVDIDKHCVSYCNSRGLNCVQGDIYNLPFEDNSFDGILLNNILEHLDSPAEAFFEIKRVLKNKGKLMIELPGRKGFYFDKTHVKFWEKDEVVQFLGKRGFQEIRAIYFPVPFKAAGAFLTHNKLRVFAVNAKKDIVDRSRDNKGN
ncbi:MAG: class I SAM-dependent methyltransferase [Nitrospirae bacterium]|nr:class I SAM-dependent methyltransferase [Nitrospirota bacterium]